MKAKIGTPEQQARLAAEAKALRRKLKGLILEGSEPFEVVPGKELSPAAQRAAAAIAWKIGVAAIAMADELGEALDVLRGVHEISADEAVQFIGERVLKPANIELIAVRLRSGKRS